MLLESSLHGAHPSQLFLQLRFGVPIGFIERVNGILQIVKLAELMGCLGKDKSDCTAKGVFSIRDHSFDWDLKLFELVFDLGEQGGQITLRTTEQWAGQQDLFGETIADRKSTRLNSSHSQISYAVFCLKKKHQYNTRS